MDNSVSIYHRNWQKLAIEIFKVKKNLSPSFMNTVFPLSQNPYNLRTNPTFKTENIRTVNYGSETISNRGPQTWALVPSHIKSSSTLQEFKAKIKLWKPDGCKCRICKIYIPNLYSKSRALLINSYFL